MSDSNLHSKDSNKLENIEKDFEVSDLNVETVSDLKTFQTNQENVVKLSLSYLTNSIDPVKVATGRDGKGYVVYFGGPNQPPAYPPGPYPPGPYPPGPYPPGSYPQQYQQGPYMQGAYPPPPPGYTGPPPPSGLFQQGNYPPAPQRSGIPPQEVQVYMFGSEPPSGVGMDYDPDSHNRFVLIVFLIVFIMLAITAAVNIAIYCTDDAKRFFKKYSLFIALPCMFVMIGLNYAMACSTCARRPPCNFVCLLIALTAMTLITAVVTCRYNTTVIMIAAISTTVTVFICMLIACSSFDFTRWIIYVVVIAAVFCVISLAIGVVMLIMKIRLKPLELALLFIGTLIQSVLLIIELQMILGGKTVQLDEDEYALGAYMLYTSIIDIFLKFVQMIGIMESM